MTDNEKANKIYEEYNKGFSLSQLGKMFGVSRQSVYAMFKARSLSLRKNNVLPYQYFNGVKFSLRNSGYYSKTSSDRMLMHRYVWEYYNKPIPKGYDIHHKDRDRTNNKIENLELMRKDEHSRKYATGNNQYTKKEI